MKRTGIDKRFNIEHSNYDTQSLDYGYKCHMKYSLNEIKPSNIIITESGQQFITA